MSSPCPSLYPGLAHLAARVVWDHEAAGSSPASRTKKGEGSVKPSPFSDICILFQLELTPDERLDVSLVWRELVSERLRAGDRLR